MERLRNYDRMETPETGESNLRVTEELWDEASGPEDVLMRDWRE
jgi:hypothetical protein